MSSRRLRRLNGLGTKANPFNLRNLRLKYPVSTLRLMAMTTFTPDELKLIGRLKGQPPQSVLQIKKPCPLHSVCNPLPLFRVYKIDDTSFEAQWNDYHQAGVRQVFSLEQ